jgi:hypothetical protein
MPRQSIAALESTESSLEVPVLKNTFLHENKTKPAP